MLEKLIGKHCKIVSKDGDRISVWDAKVTAVDSTFIHIIDRNDKSVIISISSIQKIEEVRIDD